MESAILQIFLGTRYTMTGILSQKYHPLTDNINIKIGKQNKTISTCYVPRYSTWMKISVGCTIWVNLPQLDVPFEWTCQKLARTCGMFFEIRYFLPVNVSLKLFVCFFSPIWNCGLGFCIWCSHLTDILIVKENNLSYHLSKFFSLLSPIFSGLKILKLQELFQLKLLSFVYEYINKIFPVCFHTYF